MQTERLFIVYVDKNNVKYTRVLDSNQLSEAEEDEGDNFKQFGQIGQKEINVVRIVEQNGIAVLPTTDTKIMQINLEELLQDDLASAYDLMEEMDGPGLHITGFYNWVTSALNAAEKPN